MYIVFLDTNEYKRCGHNFNATPFKKLKDLSIKRKIKLISTNVVVGEVRQHIKDDVKIFFETHRQLAKNAGVVRNLEEFNHMIAKIDIDELEKISLQAFDEFLNQTNCDVLSSSGIDNDRLINDYFNKELPFEDNSKKGDEFKDAFIVYTLKKYVADNNANLVVISQDSGFKSTFIGDENFKVFDRIDDFLVFITRTEEISKCNIQKIIEYVNSTSSLFDRFADATIETGVWTQEAVDDVSIEDVVIQNISVLYVDEIKDDMVTVNLIISAKIDISFDIIDQENSYWDKEDGEYLFYETHKLEASKLVDLNSTLELYAETNEDQKIEEISDYESIVLNGYDHGIELVFDFDIDDYKILNSTLNNSEGYLEEAHTICPDCSGRIYNHNDAGDGFCIKCSHKHF